VEEVMIAMNDLKKAYQSPELEVFGSVAELTLEACNSPGADGKSCNNLGDVMGRSTPGQGFPK
jgi:hypothetical protein